MRFVWVFVAVITAAVPLCARGQEATLGPSPGATLLHASQFTLTGHFESPLGSTAAESALRAVGEQVDAKRAATTARSQSAPHLGSRPVALLAS
jgi:hypothetical protein